MGIKEAFIDHHHYKYISYYKALLSLYRTRGLNCKNLTNSDLATYKSSETIFILGSGPSLNKLTSEQLNHINKHDSFGINYSFLKQEIIPTYQHFGWHRGRYERWKTLFTPFRESYKNVVIMMHSKSLYRRLIHPRLTPLLFPIEPIISIYDVPQPIILTEDRKITNDEFNGSLLYRGSLSLVLDIVKNMGYKKVVLLGVDLNTNDHFWDHYSEMRIEKNTSLSNYNKESPAQKFESQYPKKNKMLPFDKYLFFLSKYLEEKKGISLYIGLDNKVLSKFLPSYFIFCLLLLNLKP